MLLNRNTAGAKWRVRPDGTEKVTGKLKYLTDLSFPGMLYGKILRSEYPHALIRSINTEHAKRLPGVHAVVTHPDVPGMNRFGLVIPDQPVLCEDRVRCVGDAVAAVAAETREIAELALRFIQVDYEPLPIVDDPEAALLPSSPRLHPGGNILHRAGFKKGEPEHAFEKCAVVIEETYETPRQMHAYMETEGGVIVPEPDGGITVYAGTQHGYKDRFQLSRILAMPENKIRVVSSPMGGSFGGKDELNIQPYGALLALATQRPVKIHNSRKESVTAGLKRHPMRITMKTGSDEQGNLLAHSVRIVADTGAYASLGPAVLDFAVEHATGPYVIPNVEVEGLSVLTNNGVAGEFRGFGGNQVTFALEGQMDRLAEKLNLDPLELRRRNLRKSDDPGPLGQRIVPTDGAVDVLETVAQSPLRKQKGGTVETQWRKTGTGVAICMHGGGLGFGRPDPSGGSLRLSKDGKIEAAFGFEEFGQGFLSAAEMILIEELGCSFEDVRIVIGDTAVVPPSGSSTASRATSMAWLAIRRMKEAWKRELLEQASQATGVAADQLELGPGGIFTQQQEKAYEPVLTYCDLAARLERLPSTTVHFHFPTTPDALVGGHYLYSFSAVIAQVEVDLLTGRVRALKMDQAVSAGPVVTQMGYLGQIEGGGVMGLGFTLMEDAVMEKGRYSTQNFDSYLIPTIRDVPLDVNVEAIEALHPNDSYGPRGVGEIGTVAVAPALAAAIHDAIGYRVSRLPVSPEEILKAVTPNFEVTRNGRK
ncbi:xanthine dehydrogenase subunit D [Effusibacillus consociatus]|uniref:Xanthine dehydrogenase subunit D n=1 Tax=Effusibacillus consociatus TaxID=1117041 RepID=A0ABV9PYG7_9BACL